MPTTIFGIVIGIAMLIYAIITVTRQDPGTVITLTGMYLNYPAFLIVFGGTMASTLIAHPMSHLVRGFEAFFAVFVRKDFAWLELIDDICAFSQTNTQRGMAGIEARLSTYRKPTLLRDGLTMIVNGYKLEEVEQFLNISVERRYDLEQIDSQVFRTMGRVAPAFGFLGTVVGLIYMLRVMGETPERIGPFLAMALVSTFYGLILAHMIFNPMGNKLQHQAELNYRIGRMEMDGVRYIVKKMHPLYIKDQLSGYLPPRQRAVLMRETPGSI